MRAAVLGSGTRKTRPGNCSGSYSALEKVALMAFRSSSSPIEVLATTFWMWMTAMRRPCPVRGDAPNASQDIKLRGATKGLDKPLIWDGKPIYPGGLARSEERRVGK